MRDMDTYVCMYVNLATSSDLTTTRQFVVFCMHLSIFKQKTI